MKTLVAYYSRSGNTKKMAELIAKGLKADIDEIVDLTNRKGIRGWILAGRDASKETLTEIKTNNDPGKYELVVLGTPVWAWNATPAIRTYIAKNKDKIKKVAIFTTSGGTDPEKIAAFLEKLMGKKAAAVTGWTEKEIKTGNYQTKVDELVEILK